MKMIEVKNDWSWIALHAKNMIMGDEQLENDVLAIARKLHIEPIHIIELYSEGIGTGIENGKYLSFKDWFLEFFREEL